MICVFWYTVTFLAHKWIWRCSTCVLNADSVQCTFFFFLFFLNNLFCKSQFKYVDDNLIVRWRPDFITCDYETLRRTETENQCRDENVILSCQFDAPWHACTQLTRRQICFFVSLCGSRHPFSLLEELILKSLLIWSLLEFLPLFHQCYTNILVTFFSFYQFQRF